MTCVYSTFLINRAVVVEPSSLIASTSYCAHFFHFLQSPPLFSLLFQRSHFNYFSPQRELCMTAFVQAWQGGIWGEMICINDGWRWRGDDEREENYVRQKEKTSCLKICGWCAPDRSSNQTRPTFYLSVQYQLFIQPSGWFLHAWADPQNGALMF